MLKKAQDKASVQVKQHVKYGSEEIQYVAHRHWRDVTRNVIRGVGEVR